MLAKRQIDFVKVEVTVDHFVVRLILTSGNTESLMSHTLSQGSSNWKSSASGSIRLTMAVTTSPTVRVVPAKLNVRVGGRTGGVEPLRTNFP